MHGLFTPLMTPKGKKKNKQASPSSLNNFYYVFIFWLKGLSFKTQLKTEFWPLVNVSQVVFEYTPGYAIFIYRVIFYKIIFLCFQFLCSIQKNPSQNWKQVGRMVRMVKITPPQISTAQ